jgi:hypothetical protein
MNEYLGWPLSPARLHVDDVSEDLVVFVNIVLSMLAIAFIGLALAAWSLHLKLIHSSVISEHVERACKLVSLFFFALASPATERRQQEFKAYHRLCSEQGSTVFPILFTALASRSFNMLWRYWVNRGMRLSVRLLCSLVRKPLLLLCYSSNGSDLVVLTMTCGV